MRIVAVSWRDLANPISGGSEILVDRLLSEMQLRGHEVALVCGGPVGERAYRVVEAGGRFSQYLRAPAVLASQFRDFDVVIDVANGVPYFSPLWRKGASICLMHHVHDEQWRMHFSRPTAEVGRALECYAMPLVYRDRLFVAVSQSTRDAMERIGVPPTSIRIIESGVDAVAPENLVKARSEEPTFAVLSRFVPHKRVDLVLRAWARVQPHVGGRLLVIGDGADREKLLPLVGPGVELLGHVGEEEKRDVLSSAWMLVHTAFHEGWGMVVMEAAAVGTPALALDVAGIRDSVVHGVTGVLAPDLDSLVDAWIALAKDPVRLRRLGDAARKRALERPWSHTIDRYLEVCDEAVARAHDRASPSRRARRLQRDSREVTARELSDLQVVVGPPTYGRREVLKLLAASLRETRDPEGYATETARDSLRLIARYAPIESALVVDVGGSGGHLTEVLREHGADAFTLEPDPAEMQWPGRRFTHGVQGDGQHLPFRSDSLDVCFSSNALEHVESPRLLFDEMLRVVRPQGCVVLAFTNWFSPWGGHETAPFHYVGGEFAARRYFKKHGREPKNRFGKTLFRLDISEVLGWAREADADLVDVFPRYYPSWTRSLVRTPLIREFLTWNVVIVMRPRS